MSTCARNEKRETRAASGKRVNGDGDTGRGGDEMEEEAEVGEEDDVIMFV